MQKDEEKGARGQLQQGEDGCRRQERWKGDSKARDTETKKGAKFTSDVRPKSAITPSDLGPTDTFEIFI